MNWNELEAISLVNLYGGYNEAAKNSGANASQLSKRVANVESGLDLKIFQRAKRKHSVSLTAHGEALLPLFQQMLNTRASMLNRAKAHLNVSADSITAGVSVMLGDLGSGRLMSGFYARHPQARMTTILKSQGEIIRLLSEGMLDCAFICVPEGVRSGEYWEQMFASKCGEEQLAVAMLEESREMYVGVSTKDALAKQDTVALEELKYHCFIFNRWNEDCQWRRISFFANLGADPEDYEAMYEDFVNQDYVYRLAASGAGVLPQVFPPKHPVPGIKFLKLEGWPAASRIFFVAREYGSSLLAAFTRYVREAGGR